MERSFAQTIELTCVGCGQPFTSDVWLIVDAAERPDLVAQIEVGKLHLVQCVHCGTPYPVEAPLLFHDSVNQTLIFTPQEHSTPEEAQATARQLGQFLISRIPIAERHVYLATAQIVPDWEALRHAVMGARVQEDELSLALSALMEASSTAEIQDVAAAHRVLITPEALEQLNEYVRRLRADQHHATAEALAQRIEIIQAGQPHPTLQLIQALLEAESPEQRQRILQDGTHAVTIEAANVLEALAEQAQRQQLDAIARDMLVIRTDILRSLGREP
jgi:hypothetical protein